MDKKKTKNKNHNKKKHSASNQLAKFRGWIQAGATLLTNIYLPNFFKGEIYQGKGKAVCVPGLNCYSCPAASGACPIGSFQAVVGSSKYKFSYYITGFLILLGVLLGRFICGFLCPFGWLQDLLHKVPIKKFSTKKLKPLTYIKYAVLLLAVVLLPVFIVNDLGMGDPYFCKYICPQGVLEGALPLSAVNEGIRSALGKLFSWKLVVLISVVVLSVLFYRPFCKWICPLGAFYALFNKAKKLADEKAYDLQLNSGDDAEDVNVWDFVSLADYVSIVTNGKNWSSFFEEMLVRPEETRIAGGKEAKTQWILRLSAIKNKLSKESYSVPVDEYSYVKSVYDWIMEMLTL